jgi:methionyl-tRNA synthetase
MPRHLITSALPYINGVKHLGNLVGSMLPADVYARFLRQQGHEVLFICATDEHGTPAELAALEAGLPVDIYCEEQHAIQKRLGEQFLLSWDHFGRSSSGENRELTQHLASRLDHNGHIEERIVQQMYSPSEDRFLPDRYISGTCPRCGFPRARGDQCESCGALLDPTDLVDPASTVTGAKDLEVRSTTHLFLKQSGFETQLRDWIASKTDWPTLTTSIAKKWLDEGLRDRSITRDLRWGVPVDRPGFEDKVFYVWFDAPIEYIGATYEWANSVAGKDRDWRSWWFAADDVTYTQFMAKDNIPFHTLSFPCTLMGSGEPWKLADYIKGFNWLTYYGGKFSTSRGVGVFMDDALELLPADYWRWYLMANAPETSDVSFTWNLFAEAVNKDLADTLGNFVNRTMTFSARNYGLSIPAGGAPGAAERELMQQLDEHVAGYTASLVGVDFRKSARWLRSIWSLGNQYLERAAPWTIIRTDPDTAALVMRTALNLVHVIAILSAPIIPATSAALLNALGMAGADADWVTSAKTMLEVLQPGHEFTVPEVLFAKLTSEQLLEWETRFGPQSA